MRITKDDVEKETNIFQRFLQMWSWRTLSTCHCAHCRVTWRSAWTGPEETLVLVLMIDLTPLNLSWDISPVDQSEISTAVCQPIRDEYLPVD